MNSPTALVDPNGYLAEDPDTSKAVHLVDDLSIGIHSRACQGDELGCGFIEDEDDGRPDRELTTESTEEAGWAMDREAEDTVGSNPAQEAGADQEVDEAGEKADEEQGDAGEKRRTDLAANSGPYHNEAPETQEKEVSWWDVAWKFVKGAAIGFLAAFLISRQYRRRHSLGRLSPFTVLTKPFKSYGIGKS